MVYAKKRLQTPNAIRIELFLRSGEMPNINKPTEEQIRARAYELYLQRGGEPGREAEDWLLAEQELTELSGAQISWIGTHRSAEQELGTPESQFGDAPTSKKKTASA
jgi:hypothetical protein